MKMYVALTLIRESTDNLHRKIEIKNKDTGLIGMLPVYSMREQTEREFPGRDILEISGEVKEL